MVFLISSVISNRFYIAMVRADSFDVVCCTNGVLMTFSFRGSIVGHFHGQRIKREDLEK